MTKTETKLVVVFSRFNLKLFEVLSNEINELNVPEMDFKKHHRPERHEGHYQKQSDPMGRFEPHTTADHTRQVKEWMDGRSAKKQEILMKK